MCDRGLVLCGVTLPDTALMRIGLNIARVMGTL